MSLELEDAKSRPLLQDDHSGVYFDMPEEQRDRIASVSVSMNTNVTQSVRHRAASQRDVENLFEHQDEDSHPEHGYHTQVRDGTRPQRGQRCWLVPGPERMTLGASRVQSHSPHDTKGERFDVQL